MKAGSLYKFGIIIILLVGLPLGFYFYFHSKVPPVPPPLEKKWNAPYFMLTTQDSAVLSSDDLKGFVYIADFFFTHCNSICPRLSEKMKKLQENYKSQPRLRLISFSIDPENDSVSVLRKYAKKYEASSEKWTFLTGDAKMIRDSIATQGFKANVVPSDPADGQFTHTDLFYLVDANGVIRGFYHMMDETQTDSLYNAIERLLIEK